MKTIYYSNMKQVNNRSSISRILGISLAFLLAFSTSIFAQDVELQKKGKALFGTNCASCHALNRDMTGPKLRDVETRLEAAGKDRAWIYEWIRNSSGVIKSGDPYAVKLFNDWNKTAMTAFPQLSNEDIDAILEYTKPVDCGANPDHPDCDEGGSVTIPPAEAGSGSGVSNDTILLVLVGVLLLLVILLLLVNKTLRSIAKANGLDPDEGKEKFLPIWKAFAQNQFVILVTVILFMLSAAYFAYGYLSQVGVDQGYQPIQPIHFSHKIHAGDNGIDCKYCHSSARVSKHSGIPALNVCMNCHEYIAEYKGETSDKYDKTFYDAEIQKLYAATGWTGTKYEGEPQPVKWVRIHNLPDFAYFNHSQHVTVAGIECQECHGVVEEMEILAQHAPLTMGWCINCHRETNVRVEGNDYYKKIHEELSKKYGVEQLTAAQMGGLECGKCHY